jgi:hypothetical protein
MFWMMADSPRCGAHLICSLNFVNHKVLEPAHHVVHSMHVKADAWQQSSSPAFHLMAQTQSVLEATERNCWVQFLSHFFLVLLWITQSLHASR